MIKWSTTFRCNEVSCSCSYYSFPQTLSLLLSVILSLLISHNSGHIKLLDHHRNIPLLLTRKPQVVLIAFNRVSSWNKAAKASATQSFKTSILFPQPSTANTTTVIKILSLRSTRSYPCWFGILPKNFTPPTVSAMSYTSHHDYFSNFIGKFRCISVFFLYNGTQVILGTSRGILFVFFIQVFEKIFFVFCKIHEINIKKNDIAGLTPSFSRHHARFQSLILKNGLCSFLAIST